MEYLKKINLNLATLAVTIFLPLVIITDFIFKIQMKLDLNFINFTLPLKVIIILILMLFLIRKIHVKPKVLNSIVLITLLFSFNVLSNFSLNLETKTIYETFYLQFMFLFGLVVLVFFNEYYNSINVKFVFKVLEVFIVINFLCICLGYFFNIDVFTSYSTRFGINGVFKGNAVASYFYMLVIILFYIKKNNKSVIFLLISIISALFVGSKTLYFFIFLFGILIFYKFSFKKINTKNSKVFRATFLLFAVVFLFLLSLLLIENNEPLKTIYINNGYITALFSYRDLLIINAYDIIKVNWKPIHYMFGGLGVISKTTETGIFDLFLNYGIVGSIIYFYVFVSNIYYIASRKMLILASPIILSIIFRGNFLYFPSVILISMIIFVAINKIYKKEYYD